MKKAKGVKNSEKRNKADNPFWGVLRISMGWIFLWSFFDKLFGLGFATSPDKAWIAGSSPTYGFLALATKGPFSDFFRALAGNPLVDWLFMLGLLFIGLALIFGVGINIASISGIIMLLLMWLAALPPQYNPMLDEHIIYSLILILFIKIKEVESFSIANTKWVRQIVVKHPYLR